MTQRQRAIAMLGVLVTLVLAVLDQNIVSTASWAIVRDLDPVHGLERLPWLVSAYALAATAALPLYGKLCDVHGAKRVYLGALGAFLAGSALCGLAQDMAQLIAARSLQGLGGGGLMSVTLVVAAHLTPPRQRAAAGGAGGLLAGLGLVAGPLLGGAFTDHAGWRWIFLVNLPAGLLVLVSAALVIRLDDGGRRPPDRPGIDYPGAALVAAASVLLLLVVEWGGGTYAWGSPVMLGLVALDVLLFAAFAVRQLTAAEPVMPLTLFRDPTLRVALPLQFLTGFGMAGGLLYTVIYLQAALGIAATESGLYLVPMAAGMVLSGAVSGVLIARGAAPKPFLVAGTALMAGAMALMGLLRSGTSPWTLRLDLLLLGAGLGLVLGIVIMLVQNAAPPERLGVATTAVRFVQVLGSALGTAVFGVVLTRVTEARLPPGVTAGDLSRAGDLAPGLRQRLVDALVSGVDAVFVTGAAVMGLALLLAVLLRTPEAAAEPPPPVRVPA
ncbi:MFS transporter [Nonomuraea pusilla]|nr:MFS transporter [Nonomuraea pusilla]